MSREPTKEQRAAIEADGEILVSASAGSGKTFVMVEKMISLILSGKADVSSVLAVTYTNLAAAEMKERLRSAIVARINETEDVGARVRLKEQLSEIGTADICTVHAFCANVIRRFFYRIDADANFRIADTAESGKLQNAALDAAIETLLKNGSEDFKRLCGVYAGGRGFDSLKKEILESYVKISVKADVVGFLRDLPSFYSESAFDRVCSEYYAALCKNAERVLDKCTALRESISQNDFGGLFGAKHFAFIAEREAAARGVIGAGDLFAAVPLLRGKESSKPANTSIKKSGDEEALRLDGQFVALKEDYKRLKEAAAKVRSREEEKAAFLDSGITARGMGEALTEFERRYAEKKRRIGVMDFSDLEHNCIRLLEIPEVCEEVRERYEYVFVDEYQDVNPAQERILTLVSGKNVFMVGDVKQSIYGFRGCSAEFFVNKFEKLSASSRALTLNGNFRSRTNVLAAVNDLFSGVMTQETGSVDYDRTSRMQAGDPVRQYGGEVCVEIAGGQDCDAECEETEETVRGVYSVAEDLAPREDEEYAVGAAVAAIISSEYGKPYADGMNGQTISYGDIAVLTRNKTASAERLLAELVRHGIPVATQAEINICDYPEVKTMIEILRFLDNGSQDIPLACALKSDMGGLTDADLAAVRLSSDRRMPFYEAAANFAEGEGALAEKLRTFYRYAERLRLLSQVRSAAEIMTDVLSNTGMEASLLARENGKQRVRRLERLIAESGDLSVGDFLDRLKGSGFKVGLAESCGENAVKLMTIHASKGLEFPVVILAGVDDKFNNQDLSGTLYDEKWGFAFPCYDTQNFVRGETLLRELIRMRLRRKRSEDEMRLLYVAVTRAKERLHLVFSKRCEFDPDKVGIANSFSDFIDLSRFAEAETPVFEGKKEPPAVRILFSGEADAEAARAVRSRYCREYPFAESLALPVKTSPSEILRLRRGAAEGNASSSECRKYGGTYTKISDFSMQNSFEIESECAPLYENGALVSDSGLQNDEFYEDRSSAEIGVAYHAFLERADFSAEPRAEAARLFSLMRAEGVDCLDEKKMAQVLSLPVFSSLRGYTLWREREFLLSVPACEITESSSRDSLLVQGAIDLLAVRGDACIVVDYKYSVHDAARLLQDYTPQLLIYAAAARRISGVKTVRACIVNILRGYAVDVPL